MKQRTQTDENVGNGWRGISGSQAELAGKVAGHQPEGNRVELNVDCGQLVKKKNGAQGSTKITSSGKTEFDVETQVTLEAINLKKIINPASTIRYGKWARHRKSLGLQGL